MNMFQILPKVTGPNFQQQYGKLTILCPIIAPITQKIALKGVKTTIRTANLPTLYSFWNNNLIFVQCG